MMCRVVYLRYHCRQLHKLGNQAVMSSYHYLQTMCQRKQLCELSMDQVPHTFALDLSIKQISDGFVQVFGLFHSRI